MRGYLPEPGYNKDSSAVSSIVCASVHDSFAAFTFRKHVCTTDRALLQLRATLFALSPTSRCRRIISRIFRIDVLSIACGTLVECSCIPMGCPPVNARFCSVRCWRGLFVPKRPQLFTVKSTGRMRANSRPSHANLRPSLCEPPAACFANDWPNVMRICTLIFNMLDITTMHPAD